MKLTEFEFDSETMSIGDAMDDVIEAVQENEYRPVRVEIHSLDDPPWPTKRPDGWGVGWTCRIDGKGMIVIMLSDEQTDGAAYCPLDDSIYQFAADQITGYGPRAEVK